MSILFTLPREVILTNAGELIPGAKASFFAAGTATPQVVYTTSDLSTPHSQPVLAGSDGRFPAIYYDPTLDYKVTITDASDVEIYSEDDIPKDAVNASQVTIADAGLYYTASDVEAAFQELGAATGAGIIGITDAAANYTATDVEGALAEVFTNFASTASSEGSSLVGIEDTGGYYTGTTVEAALQEIAGESISKRSTATAKASDTAYASDPDLAGWSLGLGVYELSALLAWFQNGGDVKIQWSFTGTITSAFFQIQCVDQTGTVAHKHITDSSSPWGEYAVTTMTDTETFTMNIKAFLNVSGAGTLDLQWAQNTSNINNTTLQLGSYATLSYLSS